MIYKRKGEKERETESSDCPPENICKFVTPRLPRKTLSNVLPSDIPQPDLDGIGSSFILGLKVLHSLALNLCRVCDHHTYRPTSLQTRYILDFHMRLA